MTGLPLDEWRAQSKATRAARAARERGDSREAARIVLAEDERQKALQRSKDAEDALQQAEFRHAEELRKAEETIEGLHTRIGRRETVLRQAADEIRKLREGGERP